MKSNPKVEIGAMYTDGDGNTEVYYLKNAIVQICFFAQAPHEIEFYF